MKVLHIGKYFSPFKGGVETYLRDVMTGLQRRDVECMALVHGHEFSMQTHTEQFESAGEQFSVCRAGSLFTFYFTPVSPAFRSRIKRLVREFKPDVIHVHLPNPSACWLLTTRVGHDIPLVVHWHADVVTSNLGHMMKVLYRLYRPLERKLLERARAIVATSTSYLESSASLREYPDKCHVVSLGLDPVHLAEDASHSPPEDTPGKPLQIIAIGRLTYYKGFGYLIRAAARLDGVQVHIVGRGERERELKKLAAHLETGDKVLFHGEVPDRQLANLFVDCDCLCLPSIERTEAFGLVLLEAMYFAKPTVISNVSGSGMGSVVDDEVTGIKVPPRDAEHLAVALERLRDDRELGRRLGRAGREKFDRMYSIDHSADELLKVYRTVSGAAGSKAS